MHYIHVCIYIHLYSCFNERSERKKKEASKVKQQGKATQYSTTTLMLFRCCFFVAYIFNEAAKNVYCSKILPSCLPSLPPLPPSSQTTDLHLLETYKSKVDRFALSPGPPTSAHYLYILQPLYGDISVKEAWVTVIRSIVRLGARGGSHDGHVTS